MSGPEFHETRTGHRFLNHTMPRLVEEVERLNDILEQLLESADAKCGPDTSDPRAGDAHRE